MRIEYLEQSLNRLWVDRDNLFVIQALINSRGTYIQVLRRKLDM